MLNPIQKKRYEKDFAAIESSFRIEDMDPSGNPVYEEAKAKILSGEMTPEQAYAFVLADAKSRNRVVDLVA